MHTRKKGAVLGAVHVKKRGSELMRRRDTLTRKKPRGAELKFCTVWGGRNARQRGDGERRGID